MIRLLVRLGAVVNMFPPDRSVGQGGYERGWNPDEIEVHVTLKLGEARAAYPALHRLLLGYAPHADPPPTAPRRPTRPEA